MDPLSLAAGWLHEHALLPLLFAVGGMEWEDLAFGWALFATYGAAQVAVTFAVCVPLERWRPVERWPDAGGVWVDVLYTLLSRVGVLPLVVSPVINNVRVNKMLVDGGSGLNLISTKLMDKLQISQERLEPTGSFQGVNLGITQPLGKITLPMTFGTKENYRT